ncbi:MAG: 23S rRNA G2069 N7-methylase RlmK/C1962 C5-methylase RlmI [Hyphomicrobiaceae bacterium]|jgi:23S rRNA G2069 N7-methylase RlmK/C1962 C5-methylase RlmI
MDLATVTESSDRTVIFRDDDWLVLDKPCGISTHAADAGDLGLSEWWSLHHNETLHVISRLDKATSGVLVFALNAEASAKAQAIHEKELAGKRYLFVSDGPPPKGQWQCNDPLDDQAATTNFRVLRSAGRLSIIEATIARGRKHQIRRHALASGVPVFGDELYDGAEFPRLCLHCAQVSWPGYEESWDSPVPESFNALLDGVSDLLIDTAVAAERRGTLLDPITDATRLVHRAEILGGDFAIDRYGQWLLVTGFDERGSVASLAEHVRPILENISKRLSIRGALLRTNQRDPHRRKLIAESTVWGEAPPEQSQVLEHGIPFEIRLDAARHPGLFTDQRDNRRRLSKVASGLRVANLFAFTGAFSSVAVACGAEVAVSVDLAVGCLATAKRNFAAAGLAEGGRGKFITEDVRDWIGRQQRKRQREGEQYAGWDWIVCDPPVFASAGKGRNFSVEEDWARLASEVRHILNPTGTALFSNNHRGGHGLGYLRELQSCFGKVVRLRPPLDFPVLPDEPEHVRMFLCSEPRH